MLENRRVGRADPVAVQRYEAGEHAQFGAVAGTQEMVFQASRKHQSFRQFNGKAPKPPPADELYMTYGEVTALADFYEGFDDFHQAVTSQATFDELVNLVQLVRRDVVAFTSFAASVRAKAVSNDEWQKATGSRPASKQFVELASKNESHFAPSVTGKGESNVGTWRIYHFRALDLAAQGKLDEALIMNAFGDHFLEDAFSAGHLKSEGDVAARAKANLEAGGDSFTQDEILKAIRIKVFAYKVADGILADPTAGATLSQYLIKGAPSTWKHPLTPTWLPITADSLSDVITLAGETTKRDEFLHVFAKAVHDQLNKDISARRYGGVEVTNARGDVWKLPGDATLINSPKTLELGRLAVAQSRQNILDVARMQKTLNLMSLKGPAPPVDAAEKEVLAKQVWQYVPHPTKAGELVAQGAIERLTDPSRLEAVTAFVQISVANLPALVDQLTKLNFLKPKPSAVPQAASGAKVGAGAGAGSGRP